jgi:hypothetical protein
VGEHFVEVGVDSRAVGSEVGGCPGTCLRVWVADCYERGPRGLFEEVEGVAGAHAAESGDGDLEGADHCCCW